MTPRVLVVRVGAERVALPLHAVREVVDAPDVTPVPMAPAGLRGHFALRGQHLPVLDLATLLKIPRTNVTTPVALVLTDAACALAVDDALDVWDAGDAAARPLPTGGEAQEAVEGVLHRGSEVALLVLPDALGALAVATLRKASPL